MSAVCPDFNELEKFVDGRLGGDDSARIESHSSACMSCRERIEDVRENLRLVAPVRKLMGRLPSTAGDTPLPESIGPYHVLREIGRGGMGIVYEGEQPNPRRRVAIKVLHGGYEAGGRIERMFRREAHALARLKHPCIAAVFEAGQASDGRLFLAMELIGGSPLTEHASKQSLSIRHRAELFQRVCEAVAYAHQRGVIHRDLKPSNILVDSAGLPKLLDFGLAKILEPDDSTPAITMPHGAQPPSAVFVTEEGRVQGTLPYMSPEQVRGDLIQVDVRSDVYSLGVILFELLTGRLPYPINRTRLAESARTICETPPTRMSAADRGLRGDIETIALKALEKEPDRRYSSASALAEDIGRWLANQPILARPPTMMYQMRKLVARHKVSSALVAAMLMLIIGFGAAMSVLYAKAMTNLTRAQQAEQTAADEARRAREEAMVALQIKDFLVEVFSVSSPEVARGRTVTARELLDAAAKRVERNLDRQPAVQATIMHTIGQVYDNLGLYEEAAALLQRALVKRQELDPKSSDVADTASNLGMTLRKQGELEGARRAYETALAIMKKRDAGGDDVHVLILLQSLADVLAAKGDVVSAEATLRELLGDLRRSAHGRSGLPPCLNALAGLIAERGAHAEAVPLMREALQLAMENGTGDQFTLMSLRGNLAWLLALSGQNDEAEKIIQKELVERRRILPPKHPAIATSLITMGVIDMHRGESSRAEPLFREAVGIREAALGANHLDAVEARGFLGECLANLKRFEEAQRLLLACWESMRGTGFQPVGLPAATAFGRKEAAQRLTRLFELSGEREQAAKWRSVADGIVVPGGDSASDRDNAGLGRPSEK